MIGTYAAALAVTAASLTIGQAAIALCGMRQWSWLSPAVGLALVSAFCWGTARLPGHGATSGVVVLVATAAAVIFLSRRVGGARRAWLVGLPVALIALAAASIPFVVEGHFGILGTSFDPDMSQHLLASDRLAHGAGSQLLHQGYPLGPHAIVVALNEGLGIGLVQGFSGLTIAVVVLAPLTALAAFDGQAPMWRTAGALLVGLPYLVVSYFAQGAFKETMEALFVLAFALSLRESTRSWSGQALRFVPAAVIAIGSVYVYSFPGLAWLAATAAIWALAELAWSRHQSREPRATGPAGLRPLSLALIVFLVGALPELGRMIDFHNFETFAPHGPGLGNLFGQISPFEALGIWPSGDFRVAPGGGAMPAAGYYLAAAFATVLLIYGLLDGWRRRETAVLAAVLAAAAVYVATRVGGTPYTAAKAIEVAAPVATLAIVLPLLRGTAFTGLIAAIYLIAAGGCSLLAFANAPVGPTSYSPGLTELRPLVASGATLVLAPSRLLEEEHGTPFIAWELRGGRVCVKPEEAAGAKPPPGVRFVVTSRATRRPPFGGLRLRLRSGPYLLWQLTGPVGRRSPCPLIAVRQARRGRKP